MPNLDTFTELSGVPVHYDRFPAESGFGYGTKGRPHTFRATPSFIQELDACIDELKGYSQAKLGALEVIASAGAYVDKPGYHGMGRAFDLDALFWKNRSLVTKNFPNDPFAYVAVESVLRRHFGTVLNYDYNVDHQDHFHIDNGTSVSFQSMSKSRVTYLQYTLKFVFGLELEADGVFGPITRDNLKIALDSAALPPIGTAVGWKRYLDHAAKALFASL
jgi:hypothetical protein